MEHRFSYSVEQKSDPHPRREEHREPTEGAELGLRIVSPKPNIPILAKHEVEDEQKDDINRESEEPPRIGRDSIQERIEDIPQHLIEEHRHDDEPDNEGRRGKEHNRMDIQIEFFTIE